jgi:hypothetical protein
MNGGPCKISNRVSIRILPPHFESHNSFAASSTAPLAISYSRFYDSTFERTATIVAARCKNILADRPVDGLFLYTTKKFS